MCGGTHVQNTSEIRGVTVTKIKKVPRSFNNFFLYCHTLNSHMHVMPILSSSSFFKIQSKKNIRVSYIIADTE